MDQDLFGFVTDTTKERYLQSRNTIVNDPLYDPYSDDLKAIEQLLGTDSFEDVIAFTTLNTLLSPRAHLIKRMALIETGKAEEGDLELIIAQKILECIDLTGDGSQQKPFIVTRVSDERDYLSYIGEEFDMQALLHLDNRYLDVITITNGKNLHFDITDCYLRMQAITEEKHSARLPDENEYPETAKKKWWKFW